MKNKPSKRKILKVASGILLLSILLMLTVLPGILNDTSPGAAPKRAATGIALAILIHLVIFIAFLKVIRESKRIYKKRNGEYLGLGVLLILFGFIYMDGAIAFINQLKFVSVVMFISVFCDFLASALIIFLFLKKPETNPRKA